tara:strand:+ start:87 stop:254 length:168 start_codon:yes stop_codon:yes gene_type:complete
MEIVNMNEEDEWYEWRFCETCKKETKYDEHDVKYGCVPFVCQECKTEVVEYKLCQ